MSVNSLVLEGADHSLNHAVLLWAVGGDEHLLQTIAAYQRFIATAGEHEPIVRTEQERLGHSPKQPW